MQKFIDSICAAGLTPPNSVEIDGKIHRFSSNGKKGDKAGYYCLHGTENDFIAGFFGCWRTGIYQTWSNYSKADFNNDRKWNEYQQALTASRNEAAKLRQAEAQIASKRAEKIWMKASPNVQDHPYLKRKGIKPYGLRVDQKNNLLIPVIDFDKKLHSLQQISADPEKKKYFLTGGIITGHFFLILGEGDVFYIAEGYATAASIHEATGATVYVAFSAGNLLSVAKKLRESNPEAKIIIAADNDSLTEGNPGLTQAKEAARITQSFIVWPEFEVETQGKKLSDFNDVHSLYGLNAVKLVLLKAMLLESDSALSQSQSERKNKKTCSEELLNLTENLYLFKNHNDVIFADIAFKSHIETWPIRHIIFKQWLVGKYYENFHKAPGSQTLNDVILTLEAKALHYGQEHEIFTRIGKNKNSIYLDLCNSSWQVIEIDETGWRIIQRSPIKFIRSKGMLPLLMPERGGDINDLWKVLSIKNSHSQILILAWLLQVINPDGPYPVLIFEGPQGASKSYTSRTLRSLVDPSLASIRAMPKDERDLILAANNGLILAFDNISTIPDWLSDAFCRIATGSGFSTRKLFSDAEEIIIAVKRPIILNGIDQIVTRHDLLDRAILIHLEPIPENQRKSEKFLKEQQSTIMPKILGCLLDGISTALKNINSTKLDKLPRMADFAIWACSGITALGFKKEAFLDSYQLNRSQAVDLALECDLVSSAILDLMNDQKEWESSSTNLLQELSNKISDSERNAKEWPKSASVLGKRLVRASVFLQNKGINIISSREGAKREVTIRKTS